MLYRSSHSLDSYVYFTTTEYYINTLFWMWSEKDEKYVPDPSYKKPR